MAHVRLGLDDDAAGAAPSGGRYDRRPEEVSGNDLGGATEKRDRQRFTPSSSPGASGPASSPRPLPWALSPRGPGSPGRLGQPRPPGRGRKVIVHPHHSHQGQLEGTDRRPGAPAEPERRRAPRWRLCRRRAVGERTRCRRDELLGGPRATALAKGRSVLWGETSKLSSPSFLTSAISASLACRRNGQSGRLQQRILPSQERGHARPHRLPADR